jgi:hypothetical protein
MDKQVALIDSVAEDDDLTRFLNDKGLLTGTWKKKERRASNASFEEMRTKVQEEADARLEAKVKQEEERKYRKKHGLDRFGNKVYKGRWWQCCCCRYRPPPPPPEEEPPSDDELIEEDLTPRTRAKLVKAHQMYVDAMGFLPGEGPLEAKEDVQEPEAENTMVDSRGEPFPTSSVAEGLEVAAAGSSSLLDAAGAGGQGVAEEKARESDGSSNPSEEDEDDLEAIFSRRKTAVMGRREVNRFPSNSNLQQLPSAMATPTPVRPSVPGRAGDHPLASMQRDGTDVYKQGVFGATPAPAGGEGGPSKRFVPPLLRGLPDSDSDT